MQLAKTRKHEKLFRRLLWTGVVVLIITLFVSAGLRTAGLSDYLRTGNLPADGTIDYGYAKKPVLTLLHILPGSLFIVLGAMQFIKPLRNRFLNVHRWMGRTYLLLGLLVGVTAILMSLVIKFGGLIETTAVITFGTFFLYSLSRAYFHIRRREYVAHREWMIRAYSIGIAVATMRPIIGLFFALTQIPFSDFFGAAFWMAFIIHFTVAEMWIRYTR